MLVREKWPTFDPALAKEDEIEYAVQVNGKVRSHITVPADATEEEVKKAALSDHKTEHSRWKRTSEGDRGAGKAGRDRG